MDDKEYLNNVMKEGQEKAIIVADSVLKEVYSTIGLSKAQYPQ